MDNLMTDEFKIRIFEEYGVRPSTVEKYAKSIADEYSFVLSNQEKFEEVIEEVVSDLYSLSENIYNDGMLSKKEKDALYSSSLSIKISKEVRDKFSVEFEKRNQQKCYDFETDSYIRK